MRTTNGCRSPWFSRRSAVRSLSILAAVGLVAAGCNQSKNLSSAPAPTQRAAPPAPTTPPIVPAPPLTPLTIPAPAVNTPQPAAQTTTTVPQPAPQPEPAPQPAPTPQPNPPADPPVITQPGSFGNPGAGAGSGSGTTDSTCQLTAAPAPGSSTLTFVADGKLMEIPAGGGSPVCLKQLTGDELGQPAWAPDGNKVLLNPSALFDAFGVHGTGFVASNGGVRWSMPTGKSLIAPAVKDGKLLKRLAGKADSRQDISFLTNHDAVAYHPGGKHIVASGFGPEGPGLYIASNLGKDPRMIAQILEPDTKIIEIATTNSGAGVVFVHDHGTFRHVHLLSLPDLGLTDLIQTPAEISELALSPNGRVAFTAGSCGNGTAQLVTDPGVTVDLNQGPLAGQATFVVGWVDDSHVVVGAGSKCSGPVSGFIVNADNPADVQPVVDQVEFLAVRTAVGAVGDLPGEILAQAPG